LGDHNLGRGWEKKWNHGSRWLNTMCGMRIRQNKEENGIEGKNQNIV
jgi:hypothetical protein